MFLVRNTQSHTDYYGNNIMNQAGGDKRVNKDELISLFKKVRFSAHLFNETRNPGNKDVDLFRAAQEFMIFTDAFM